MKQNDIYTFLHNSLINKQKQEIFLLSKYFLFSSIFELPQKDILFFYPESKLFSAIGLLHFSKEEIVNNEIDVNAKLKLRKCLNDVYTKQINDNAYSDLLVLFRNLKNNDQNLISIIRGIASEYGIEPNTVTEILEAEAEQLLRIFKYSEEPQKVYEEFINNIEFIKNSNISNANIRLHLCNFISNYLETVNPDEFYMINNTITVAELYSGVNLGNIKNKLDYYSSVIRSEDYISKKIDYLIKINNSNKEEFKYLFSIISNLNKRDLEFLIDFSNHFYNDEKLSQEANQDMSLLTDSSKVYELLDNLRQKELFTDQITQFFMLTVKYQTDFLEYIKDFNITILHFIYENGGILNILFSTYEGAIDIDINNQTKNEIVLRIRNKTKFIVETLTNFIATPLNFEIYNLNRAQTLLKKVIKLRTHTQSSGDNNGIILNILNSVIKYKLLPVNELEVDLLINNTNKVNNVIEQLSSINSSAVNAYKAIISGVFSTSRGYSLLSAARTKSMNQNDIGIAVEIMALIEDLRKIGFSNIFLEDNQHIFQLNKEVLIEYFNGANV